MLKNRNRMLEIKIEGIEDKATKTKANEVLKKQQRIFMIKL